MAASKENGVEERLNVGGSIRVKVPVRRLLRMPIRLLPRVGERPAGADMGLLVPRERLLSFFAGDFGFRIDRGRGDAPFRGLLNTEADTASLLLGNAEVVDDLVMMNDGGLKKSLFKPSAFDLLENRSAGSTFSKSSTLRKSATLRFPGVERAVKSLALVDLHHGQRGGTRPAPVASQSSIRDRSKAVVRKDADRRRATTHLLADFSRLSSSAVASHQEARTADV